MSAYPHEHLWIDVAEDFHGKVQDARVCLECRQLEMKLSKAIDHIALEVTFGDSVKIEGVA